MKHYYSTVDGVVLTHSDMTEEGYQRTVYVRFERPNEKGFDFAEGALPSYTFTKTYGFSEDELFVLSDYLLHNALLIWDFAQTGGGMNMQTVLRLPALDADVVIDGDTVSLTNGAGESAQVSKDEWDFMREDLRFDDAIDYARGETPMTVYQFNAFVALIRDKKRLEAEHERLLAEIRAKSE